MNKIEGAKFYVMRIGYCESDLAWLVANPRPASVQAPDRPATWSRFPVLVYLLVHPECVLLFDTSCDPDGMNYWPRWVRNYLPYYIPEDERLENRLAAVGLAPEDIDVVVLSHLHYDHAGNVGLFKKSRILVPRADFVAALVNTHADPSYSGGYMKREFDVESLRYELIDEDVELLPGVELIIVGGHTPAMLNLIVHLPETGTIICTSDAIATRMNYGPPLRLPGVVYDSVAFYRDAEKVRRLQNRYGAQVFFGHDQEQYEKEMRKFPEFYI